MLDAHLIAQTRPQTNPENVILFGNRRVSVLTDRLFRIERDSEKLFCDEATQAVWFRDMDPVPFTSREENGTLTVSTGAATLVLAKSNADSYVILGKKKIPLSNEGNLLGTYRTLDRCDGNCYVEDDKSLTPIQLETGVVSRNGVAIYDDTKSLILKQDGSLAARNDDDEDLYVFAYGHDYRGALRALFTVCGKVPMIPRYALGNWWSRYHAYSDKEYLHILDSLTARDVPLTVATIDMDWHWSTTLDARKRITELGKNDEFRGGANGWTGYSWNTDLFPDYKAFLQKIKDRNLKITLNLHPAKGIRWFEDMYPEMARAMGIDPATEEKIPFDFTSDRFINAYFKILHKPYEHDGVEFWWIDWQQGTTTALSGLDPLWALNHYHTLDNAKEHQPMILSRYCGIGSHRYPLGFSGDTYIDWKSLQYIPFFTANASNAGYTWWSHDIGGHMGGYKEDELYLRDVQFGVFSPINRLHCCNSSVCTKEPVVYMNGTGRLAEEYLRLRHRMIPFLYSAAYETNENGKALIEPMYYEYPEEKNAYRCPNQYLFGGQLLVAPVTTPGDKKRLAVTRVWVPEGHWTDIFTGDEYDGGRFVEMVRWMDSIPVLAKEGGFFVLDGRTHSNRTDNPDSLDVMVFNGNGSYTLHEDGEAGRADTVFTSTGTAGRQELTILASGDAGVIPTRQIRLEFRNVPTGKVTVRANGRKIAAQSDDNGFVTVTVPAVKAGVTYCVTVEYQPLTRTEFRNARLLYSLQRIEGVNKNKSNLNHFRTQEDDELRKTVLADPYLNRNEKKRLLENI